MPRRKKYKRVQVKPMSRLPLVELALTYLADASEAGVTIQVTYPPRGAEFYDEKPSVVFRRGGKRLFISTEQFKRNRAKAVENIEIFLGIRDGKIQRLNPAHSGLKDPMNLAALAAGAFIAKKYIK